MEALEEPPVQYAVESVKGDSAIEDGATPVVEPSLCYASNGVAEYTAIPVEASEHSGDNVDGIAQEEHSSCHAPKMTETVAENAEMQEQVQHSDGGLQQVIEEEILAAMETEAAVESLLGESKEQEEITEEVIETTEAILCNEVTIEGSMGMMDTSDVPNEKVTLRTEVLIEKSDDDIQDANEVLANDHNISTNNILDELGQGIELSEALRSSDTADNVENNNDTVGEEVFNKEELLDILEGNDNVASVSENMSVDAKKILEAQIALNQLSRLQRGRKKKTRVEISPTTPKVTRPRKKKKSEKNDEEIVDTGTDDKVENEKENSTADIKDQEQKVEPKHEVKQNESIVNTLVKDWDDDEPPETEGTANELLEQSENLLKETEQLVKQGTVKKQNLVRNRKSVDSPIVDAQPNVQSKSGDESQPQRRLGRVIKKKVPFDPDNPDTFTKSKEKDKVITKTKEPLIKEPQPEKEKEQPIVKKPKSEQTVPRPKSKSPVGKQQWKKPPCKNSNKNNKRLTEVDKLLMDEGAVNMIYQLTPEAPKGKKNMRTKAEFIKKLQSSTPDSKEMKFRERKRENKSEEGDPKKILGGKSSRSSMSGSIKSPSAAEDFEAHSADDSIIYRRHSSSSYSSTCMSPRRLSDIEGAATQNTSKVPQNQNQSVEENDKSTDIFMAENNIAANETINKDDCMSIKEKLNTKLSLALNKRKREITPKTEKPPKQKRISKSLPVEKDNMLRSVNIDKFKHVSVTYEQRLVEICIRKVGPGFNIETVKELEEVLLFVDNRKDISVILLTSECGTICSNLDLRPLLGDNMEIRTNYAHSIAEAVRSLLFTVAKHSKLVVSGVWGPCTGVGLALVALSNVALASEHATFSVSSAPPLPGAAALTARCSRLSHTLVNDLIVFGKSLSTTEALQGGLVSRSVPGAGPEIVRAVAKELAAKPAQTILLQKHLLALNQSVESEKTFQIGLEKERDLLVEYWTSIEGQDMLREVYNQ